MYKKFFGLRANPFNLTPDPRFLFLTPRSQEALACLTYGIESRKGFVLLSGEVGTGKTTLINKLLEWLKHQRIPSAFIFNPRMEVEQVLDYIIADFGITPVPQGKSQALRQLYHWLLDRHRAGETAVVIIDEAQRLPNDVLEEVRLLTNLKTFTQKLLQVVLVGRPELEDKLRQTHLHQRVTLQAKTFPLSQEETHAYVAERLRIAGSNGRALFEPAALDAIFRYSGGIPRVTNLLCEHSLVGAFVDQRQQVHTEIVDAVARDFDLCDSPPAGPPLTVKEKIDLMEALKTLSELQEQMNSSSSTSS
jgi:general secretion pathway protein A